MVTDTGAPDLIGLYYEGGWIGNLSTVFPPLHEHINSSEHHWVSEASPTHYSNLLLGVFPVVCMYRTSLNQTKLTLFALLKKLPTLPTFTIYQHACMLASLTLNVQ